MYTHQNIKNMHIEYLDTLVNLGLAVLAGGIIGLERTFHGRPAGFRTHTLVCTASALLMLVTVYQTQILPAIPLEIMRIDPTRMAQGIMTGIGFLGAGVIMKEGLTIRGLTTAASIWITASIGILIGLSFYIPAAAATVITVGTLALFRWIETIMPSLHYGLLTVRFHNNDHPKESDLKKAVSKHRCDCANTSFSLLEGKKFVEYQMTIRTKDTANFQKLASALSKMKHIYAFSLTPTGD